MYYEWFYFYMIPEYKNVFEWPPTTTSIRETSLAIKRSVLYPALPRAIKILTPSWLYNLSASWLTDSTTSSNLRFPVLERSYKNISNWIFYFGFESFNIRTIHIYWSIFCDVSNNSNFNTIININDYRFLKLSLHWRFFGGVNIGWYYRDTCSI